MKLIIKTKKSLLVALLASATHHASATVLTLNITDGAAGITMQQEYGDKVTTTTSGLFSYGADGGFTPNVVVEYTSPDSPTDLSFWTTGYSDLTNVLYNEPDGENSYTVRFVADSGFLVRLDAFDLGNFGGAVTLPGLRIEDGLGNSLFSLNNIFLGAAAVPHQNYNFLGGLFAEEIRIIVNTTGLAGNSDNIGLDNIQFSQTAVPEPSAAGLLIAGAALMLRRRRFGAAICNRKITRQ